VDQRSNHFEGPIYAEEVAQISRPGVRPHGTHGTQPKIGLALGGGSARGWAHIGVIRTLEKAGIVPYCIAGTSIGSLVGGAHSLGMLGELENWAQTVNWRSLLSLLDVSLNLRSGPLMTGLIQGDAIVKIINSSVAKDKTFADCRIPFACVACDIKKGKEVWLRSGPIVSAVRASISVPGMISPHYYDGPDGPMWLVDGGLVNPVPVSLAYALGADIVIAVSLNRGTRSP
jgi:NTE family protein